MKKRIITTISALFMCTTTVSCGDVAEKCSVIVNETTTEIVATDELQTEHVSTSAITTSAAEITTSAAITTTVTEITSAAEDEDIKNIVKEICMRYYDVLEYSEEDAERDAEYMIERAKEFTKQDPVNVNSEDAAKSRAKTVFIEFIGQEFIDELESDYYEKMVKCSDLKEILLLIGAFTIMSMMCGLLQLFYAQENLRMEPVLNTPVNHHMFL